MKLHRSFLAVLTALALPIAGGAPRAAAEDVDVGDLYKKVVKSCVFIVTPAKGGYGMGSGSLIDADKRLVLTNFHVVDEEESVFVQFPVFLKDGELMTDKQEYLKRIPAGLAIKGKVLYRDKSRDLAIVQLTRVPAGTPAIPLAKKSIAVGSTTWNIGSPGELKQVFGITTGHVRSVGVEKMLVGGGDPSSVFEVRAKVVSTTNAVNPGDSGGPLFDKRGYQVAVTQSGNRRASLINHFIDITEVRALLNEKKITIKELSDEPDAKLLSSGSKKDPVKDDAPVPPKDNGTAVVKKDPPKDAAPAKDPNPIATQAQESEAAGLLRRAKLFSEGDDNRSTYEAKLKEIVKKYPGTTAAKEAEKLLKGLK